jgi:hypothetical protein
LKSFSVSSRRSSQHCDFWIEPTGIYRFADFQIATHPILPRMVPTAPSKSKGLLKRLQHPHL